MQFSFVNLQFFNFHLWISNFAIFICKLQIKLAIYKYLHLYCKNTVFLDNEITTFHKDDMLFFFIQGSVLKKKFVNFICFLKTETFWIISNSVDKKKDISKTKTFECNFSFFFITFDENKYVTQNTNEHILWKQNWTNTYFICNVLIS